MLLLIAFAFLAGMVTVLSPCVLPVLPVILSGTAGSGRSRPWGIAAGFVLTFTLLTLFLSALVQLLGLDPSFLRWTAAVLILVFALILIIPRLQGLFQLWVGTLVSKSSPGVRRGGGFWGGVVLGAGLGAVWTPCVGPIMASVATLALTRSVSGESVVITLAYALGTALPLTAFMLGGRVLMEKLGWLKRRSETIQRVFGVLMLVTALALITGADRGFSTWLLQTFPSYGEGLTRLETQPQVQTELKKQLTPSSPSSVAPAADPLTLSDGAWINSPPLQLGALKGQVVLVDFWTYSCINCLRTLPHLKQLYEKYKDRGLVLVGVHSPEFAFEKSEANVRKAVADLGIPWPVVQDNSFGIWNSFQNEYWPAHYLFDRTGKLVETHFGEGGEKETEEAVQVALNLPGPLLTTGERESSAEPRTPETYLGWGRGERFQSPQTVVQDGRQTYAVPSDLALDHWAFSGSWTIGKELSLGEAGSSLELRFQAQKVHLVAGAAKEPAVLRLLVDGQPAGTLTVTGEKLYTLVSFPQWKKGILRIETDHPLKVYSFTFG